MGFQPWPVWDSDKPAFSMILVIIFRSDMAETVYQFEAKDSQGRSISLDTFRGKVILVVNVASKWVHILITSFGFHQQFFNWMLPVTSNLRYEVWHWLLNEQCSYQQLSSSGNCCKMIVPMQMRVNGQLVQAAGGAAGTSCVQGSCHPCLPLQPGEIVIDDDSGQLDMVL